MNPSDLLSLPTDSLYKFLALSGLAITAISLILPEFLLKNLKFNIYEVRMSHDITFEKEKDFIRRSKIYSEKQNKTLEEVEIYEKESLDNRCARIQIDKEVKEIEYLVAKFKVVNSIQIFSILLGLSMFISGFYLWYTKLQIFLDAAIKTNI